MQNEYLEYEIREQMVYMNHIVPKEVMMHLVSLALVEMLFSGGDVHEFDITIYIKFDGSPFNQFGKGFRVAVYNFVLGELSFKYDLSPTDKHPFWKECQSFIDIHTSLGTMTPLKIAEGAFNIATGKAKIQKIESYDLPEL